MAEIEAYLDTGGLAGKAGRLRHPQDQRRRLIPWLQGFVFGLWLLGRLSETAQLLPPCGA